MGQASARVATDPTRSGVVAKTPYRETLGPGFETPARTHPYAMLHVQCAGTLLNTLGGKLRPRRGPALPDNLDLINPTRFCTQSGTSLLYPIRYDSFVPNPVRISFVPNPVRAQPGFAQPGLI